jgi:hypothetical protein
LADLPFYYILDYFVEAFHDHSSERSTRAMTSCSRTIARSSAIA